MKVEKGGIIRCFDSDCSNSKPEWNSANSIRGNTLERKYTKFTSKAMHEYIKGLHVKASRILTKSNKVSRTNPKGLNKTELNSKIEMFQASPDIEEEVNITLDDIDEDKSLEQIPMDLDKTKKEIKKSSESFIINDNDNYQCSCGKDNKLPCCKRAAVWLNSSYGKNYDVEKFRKDYFVYSI